MQDDRNDEQFEQLFRETAKRYRIPPTPRLDALWPAIEASLSRPRRRFDPMWAYAAMLVIGVGLGYGGALLRPGPTAAALQPTFAEQQLRLAGNRPTPFVGVANDYVERTTALLDAVTRDIPSGRVATGTVHQARQLLSTTRLLLDAGVADARMRELLQDLELVLVQVVRLQDTQPAPDAALLSQSLARSEVLSRLSILLVDSRGAR